MARALKNKTSCCGARATAARSLRGAAGEMDLGVEATGGRKDSHCDAMGHHDYLNGNQECNASRNCHIQGRVHGGNVVPGEHHAHAHEHSVTAWHKGMMEAGGDDDDLAARGNARIESPYRRYVRSHNPRGSAEMIELTRTRVIVPLQHPRIWVDQGQLKGVLAEWAPWKKNVRDWVQRFEQR